MTFCRPAIWEIRALFKWWQLLAGVQKALSYPWVRTDDINLAAGRTHDFNSTLTTLTLKS